MGTIRPKIAINRTLPDFILTWTLAPWIFALPKIYAGVLPNKSFVNLEISSTQKKLSWSFATPNLSSGLFLDQNFLGVKITSSKNQIISQENVSLHGFF